MFIIVILIVIERGLMLICMPIVATVGIALLKESGISKPLLTTLTVFLHEKGKQEFQFYPFQFVLSPK